MPPELSHPSSCRIHLGLRKVPTGEESGRAEMLLRLDTAHQTRAVPQGQTKTRWWSTSLHCIGSTLSFLTSLLPPKWVTGLHTRYGAIVPFLINSGGLFLFLLLLAVADKLTKDKKRIKILWTNWSFSSFFLFIN